MLRSRTIKKALDDYRITNNKTEWAKAKFVDQVPMSEFWVQNP